MPKHIFREYDIRGLAEKELTDETSRAIGRAFGAFLAKKKGAKGRAGARVGVAYDLRPSSVRIHQALVEGLTQAGSDVFDLGLVPTPLLYYGVVHFQLDAGISITGSHNPPQYNGFKFQLKDRPFYGEDIQGLREAIEGETAKIRAAKSGKVERADPIEPYLAELKQQFKYSKKWKIVIDCGHAMAGLVAPKLFKELGQDVIELYTHLDPKFPDHHPDPSVLENLEDLSNEVRRQNAHLGIAFDGDADRIGVVDEKGNPFLGDRLLTIFARQVLKKQKGAAVVADVKCSPLLYRDIEKRGGRPILWKTGHSLIKAKMKEERAALGGEMSGHMFFADRWYGFDDAIYAACRMVEILDEEKRPVSELLADLPEVVSTPEIRIEVSDDRKKFEIVEKAVAELKTRYKVIDLDGARLEFEDGFGLIRASNTQPVLVMRFEATSQKRLDEIRSLIEETLQKYA
ncbi:MAG: phosphomannomutase/phosphoglucomutase [Candidatus Omnitrophica bacterium]|nr:phosphomannomutase/phosphoglucomutase [Candidatus Omnitrophota bacterium]